MPRSTREATLVSMRTATLALSLAAALVAPAPLARAQEAAPPWYDAAPLLAHVRPAQREGLAERVEVAHLEDLPLYDLHLSIEDRMRAFGLRETIYVTNTERTAWPEIVLRVFANAVGGADGEAPAVSMIASECLDGVSCTIEQTAPSVIRVRPGRPLAPGARLRIQLDLQGRTRAIDASQTTMAAQGMEGLAGMMGDGPGASGDHGMLAHGLGIGSFAHFFAVVAARRRGAWVTDDGGTNGDLGTGALGMVRARIVVPADVQVASSGIEVRSVPVRDPATRAPRREITVSAGLVRDFALVASASLESTARDVSGVSVRSWYLPAERAAGRRVLEAAASSLALFEQRFGPYPFTELDVVEAPLIGGAGGVEFSSLVTIASMFYQPAGSGGLGPLGALMGGGSGGVDAGEMQDAMLEFVTAHEVAHQWWYGLVGSDSREHPWVDESLAQWSAMHWVESRYGAARAQQEADRHVAMGYRAMRMMGLPDGAVDRPASAFTPPIAYAGLVYGKGPYLYGALRAELGDEAFFTGLRAYATRYRHRDAPGRGPIDTLATGPHAARVRALARRWLDQSHGDEDVGGTGDPAAMLGSMVPPELRDQLADPAMQSVLRQLLQGMAGAGGGDMSPQDAARLQEQMQQVLGGLPDTSTP